MPLHHLLANANPASAEAKRTGNSVARYIDYIVEHQDKSGWLGPGANTTGAGLFWARYYLLYVFAMRAESTTNSTLRAESIEVMLRHVHASGPPPRHPLAFVSLVASMLLVFCLAFVSDSCRIPVFPASHRVQDDCHRVVRPRQGLGVLAGPGVPPRPAVRKTCVKNGVLCSCSCPHSGAAIRWLLERAPVSELPFLTEHAANVTKTALYVNWEGCAIPARPLVNCSARHRFVLLVKF